MPEADSALSDQRLPADPNASPVAESPNRRTPVLQTPNDEPIQDVMPLDAPSRSGGDFRRFAGLADAVEEEIANADLAAPKAATSFSSETPSNAVDASLQHTQNVRRVQEFSAETHAGRKVREWDGAEHEGTVVAQDAGGVVLHVGRNEYMHVPSQTHSTEGRIVGAYATVDRSGRLNADTFTGRERSRDDLGRGGR